MNEYYKIVYDWNEIEKFYNLLPELQREEVFFVSLSCRNKYLTKEKREEIGLSKTEMFAKSVIRRSSWQKFKSIISRFECNKDSYITQTGFHYPEEAIICYMSINPKSQYKAFNNFTSKINNVIAEYTLALMKNKNSDGLGITNKLKRLDVEYMNSLVQSKGTRTFIDVDFDIDKNNKYLLDDFIIYLDESNIDYIVVETKGGFHTLLYVDTLNNTFYGKIIELDKRAKKDNPKFEIIKNNNEMVPLPGTLQGMFPVKVIKHKRNN